MNLLIFGASGGTGRELVKQALEQGHRVTAFVRDPVRLPLEHAQLTLACGDVSDGTAVSHAVPGHDAVLSALGVGRPLQSDPAVIEGVRHIVKAMESAQVRRLIYLSTIGVSESRAAAGAFIRYVAARILRHEFGDHEIKEDVIRRSAVDWTLVRAPKLTNGSRTGAYQSGEHIAARSILPTLSRADVAEFMLRQLADTAFQRKVAIVLP